HRDSHASRPPSQRGETGCRHARENACRLRGDTANKALLATANAFASMRRIFCAAASLDASASSVAFSGARRQGDALRQARARHNPMLTTARAFYGWRVAGAAFVLAAFGWGVGFYGPPVFLSAVHEGRGWSVVLVSTAVTVHFLAGAVTAANLAAVHR